MWRNRREGAPAPELNAGMRSWLDKAGMANALDVQDIALPYHYGRESDLYHFSYAWIYPAP